MRACAATKFTASVASMAKSSSMATRATASAATKPMEVSAGAVLSAVCSVVANTPRFRKRTVSVCKRQPAARSEAADTPTARSETLLNPFASWDAHSRLTKRQAAEPKAKAKPKARSAWKAKSDAEQQPAGKENAALKGSLKVPPGSDSKAQQFRKSINKVFSKDEAKLSKAIAEANIPDADIQAIAQCLVDAIDASDSPDKLDSLEAMSRSIARAQSVLHGSATKCAFCDEEVIACASPQDGTDDNDAHSTARLVCKQCSNVVDPSLSGPWQHLGVDGNKFMLGLSPTCSMASGISGVPSTISRGGS